MPTIVQLNGMDVDVSQWMDKHPGGRKLLKIFANRDATQQFNAIHKGDAAAKMLKSLPQTPSKKKPNYAAAEKEFNEIIEALKPTLSKVNVHYEALKLGYVWGVFFGGYYACFMGYKMIGLIAMTLAMYQAGWIGHDYSHRSVFPSPKLNNYMSDALGCIQGYSDVWWKARHNTHHMVTNELDNDPDIRTEPLFHFYDKTKSKLHKHMPLQNVSFIFVLSLLDLFWRYESIVVCMKPAHRHLLSRLAFHYALLAALVMFTDVTFLDLCVQSLVRGFMTASIVFANHYPEDRLPPDHTMGLFEQTLLTSRNTTGYFFHHPNYGIARWLFNEASGYLSMQVEHHLAPTWPSGNLMKLRPHIQALAKKYDLPYRETSVVSALWDNIMKLSDVSIEQLRHVQ
jgi:fatty acid desaturase